MCINRPFIRCLMKLGMYFFDSTTNSCGKSMRLIPLILYDIQHGSCFFLHRLLSLNPNNSSTPNLIPTLLESGSEHAILLHRFCPPLACAAFILFSWLLLALSGCSQQQQQHFVSSPGNWTSSWVSRTHIIKWDCYTGHVVGMLQ